MALCLEMHCLVGIEDKLAGRRTRRSGQPLGENRPIGIGVERRMKELVELIRVDGEDRLIGADQPLLGHVDGDLERGLGRALARAGLQHEELAFLHGELDVLEVAEVGLELAAGALQLGEGVGHQGFERGIARAGALARKLGQGLWGAQAGDHVLSLRIHQIFAVKLLRPGRRIAREDNAGRALVAAIAEHHGLNGDGSPPAVGNVMQAPIGDGTRVLPRAEHGGDRAPELVVEVLRERLAELALDESLVATDDRHPILRRKLSVVFESLEIFEVLEDLLEQLVVDAEHHIGIHLDEAAIGVVGKSSIARSAREPFDGLVVEAEIEHGVHHAGHRGAAARTDRHEQRILDIAEFRTGDLAYRIERLARPSA